MENLEERASRMTALSKKVIKILDKEDDAMSFAVINFVFLGMVIGSEKGPVVARAMAATFLNNVVNSIDSYYREAEEGENVH